MRSFGRLFVVLWVCTIAAMSDEVLSAAEQSAAKSTPANYARPFEPPTRPAFITLPPGAVEPAGWLRDWCLKAKDGYTGHLDEYDPEFVRAWSADHKMTGIRLAWPNGAWPYEGGGYWFDGLARLGYVLHDEALIQQAKRRLDVAADNMDPNGIAFLWWLNKNNSDDMKAIELDRGWPLWVCGLIGRSMVGYYEGSREERTLRALEMAYSNFPDAMRTGCCTSTAWPAFQTYTWTGNKQIATGLDALFAADGGGKAPGGDYWNRYRRMPKMEPNAETNDHGVRFFESTAPWALGYLWTGNREYLDATLAWNKLIERDCMQPYGVPVTDEFYGPTGPYRGTETCDVAAYLWSQMVLLSVSGDGRMADRAERAFFNAGPATVDRDFKKHVYFQSPNRIADQCPPISQGPGAAGTFYQPKHAPLCCTAALNRILPNYVMHMWMATYDNGLAAAHYGPCKASALVADRVAVELICKTDYPFNDIIDIDVAPAKETTFPLSFRMPGWCKSPELSINDTEVKAASDDKGFVRIERLWKRGDTVRLRFPMSVCVEKGRDNNSQDAPYAAVSYGPLLFALPIADTTDANTADPVARWKYALDLRSATFANECTVERQAMPPQWDWPLASPVKLSAGAVPCDWNPEPKNPLPPKPIAAQKPSERITLIPYGCTKFRISMFPVAEQASPASN